MISSPANPRIVRVRRLNKRRERERRDAVIVEGRRAVESALRAGALHAVFVTPAGKRRAPDLLDNAGGRSIERHEVTPEVMASISRAPNPSAWLGVARTPVPAAGETSGPTIMLLNVHEPTAAGALIGLAASLAGAVIIGPGCTDPFAPRVIRAAGGAHYRSPVRIGSAAALELVAAERARGRRTVALAGDGDPPWTQDLTGRVTVLVGVEPDDAEAFAAADVRVGLPSADRGPGLAMGAAVVLYEWVRQRENPT